MRILKRGHVYELAHRGKDDVTPPAETTTIHYVNREPGQEEEGVISQEVLRMLIDRTHYCNNCQPHRVNEEIIYHLRMALVLHESRALERGVQKGEIQPEHVTTGKNGHFSIDHSIEEFHMHTLRLDPVKPEWEKDCNHTSHL